jgi:protein gp37
MADSSIEWTRKTWNPTTGCTHYSSKNNGGNECLNCYAESETKRLKAMGQERYKMGFNVVVEHEDVLNEPYKWKKPEVVFVNSMSDLFHKDISNDFISKVFKVMNDTPQHTYQILTKRHDRFEKLPDDLTWSDNIWMGVSCGTQYSTRRIPALVNSKAKHKFLSIEPFIQEITDIDLTGIDWVIVGAESGKTKYQNEKDENGEDKFTLKNDKVIFTHALDENGNKIIEKVIRPVELEWIEKIKERCNEQNVPFFFKQWGLKKFNPNPNDPTKDKRHKYYSKGGCMINGELYLDNPSSNFTKPYKIELFDNEYYVLDDVNDVKTIWELKSYLPMMEKSLFEQLEKDIKKNGLNDPILYFKTPAGDNLVIEGHTRLEACVKQKIKIIPTKEIKANFQSLDDIKFWMVQHQVQRRNLSVLEKVKLSFTHKEIIEIKAKENQSKAGKKNKVNVPLDTNDEIARIAGVSRATVVRYGSIVDKASDKIKQQLDNGSLSIFSAYNIIKDKTPKPITQTQTKQLSPIIYQDFEECEQALESGTIEAIIILNNPLKTSIFNNNQLKKVGFLIK